MSENKNKDIVDALSDKYSYDDIVKMQAEEKELSISDEDIKNSLESRPEITKDTPNPFSKRLLIELILVVVVIAAAVFLRSKFEDNRTVEIIISAVTGLISIEMATDIIKYFRFNKVKKNSKK